MRTIKRHRCMTMRKGMRKSMRKIRRTNNRKKTNRIKTRRQSGGRFSSFIDANDNTDAQGKKGIDVKVELDDKTGQPLHWLIGGDGFMDATFRQLQDGAKEGRYIKFIGQLLTSGKDFSFANKGSSMESSKGIKLTHALFCEMFINNPQLTYPILNQRFRERGYTCPQSSASSASSASPFISDQEAREFALGPAQRFQAPERFQAPAQPHPNQTNAAFQQFKVMGFEDAAIRNALLQTNNNVDAAIELLLRQPSAATPSAAPPRPAARGGVVSAAPISAAPPPYYPPPYYPPTSAAPSSAVSAVSTAPPSAAPIRKGPFNTPPCTEYFKFEKWLHDDQPDKILKQKYGIDVNDANSLDISLGWANASYECNNIDQFLQYADRTKVQTRGDYEALVMGSIEMEVLEKIKIGQTQKAKDNGWCFYSAVLTAAHKPNDDVRKFAQAITYCVLARLTNTEVAIRQRVRTRINGIISDITVEQLMKLISIPNLTEKNGPCVYPELDQCIGQAAAYLLNKNIIVYDESGNLIGKYRGIDSTNPADQIYLVNTNANHFDIITSHS